MSEIILFYLTPSNLTCNIFSCILLQFYYYLLQSFFFIFYFAILVLLSQTPLPPEQLYYSFKRHFLVILPAMIFENSLFFLVIHILDREGGNINVWQHWRVPFNFQSPMFVVCILSCAHQKFFFFLWYWTIQSNLPFK